MLNILKQLFTSKPAVDYAELIANKAVILDVRTKGEYQGGHLKGSLNIPLQSLTGGLGKLPKNKVIITCCASGSRSRVAKSILKSNGYEFVYNGGSWLSLRKYI